MTGEQNAPVKSTRSTSHSNFKTDEPLTTTASAMHDDVVMQNW